MGHAKDFIANLRYKKLRLVAAVLLVMFIVTLPHHTLTWHLVNFVFLVAYGAVTIFLFIKDRSTYRR
jgi:hypothetical protein